MLKRAPIWLALLFGFLSACSSESGRDYVNADPELKADMTVAVLPFENLSNQGNAGVVAAQLIASELYNQGLFQVMEETEVRKRLSDGKVDINRLSNAAVARQVAKLLQVDAVLIGAVSEFGYQHGLREEPTVGMNARLVSANDGKVLWVASHAAVGPGLFARESLTETAQRVARRMVAGLRAGVRR
jgi:polysaccharide biosynthesis protein PelC